jgi:hypothetical protein
LERKDLYKIAYILYYIYIYTYTRCVQCTHLLFRWLSVETFKYHVAQFLSKESNFETIKKKKNCNRFHQDDWEQSAIMYIVQNVIIIYNSKVACVIICSLVNSRNYDELHCLYYKIHFTYILCINADIINTCLENNLIRQSTIYDMFKCLKVNSFNNYSKAIRLYCS